MQFELIPVRICSLILGHNLKQKRINTVYKKTTSLFFLLSAAQDAAGGGGGTRCKSAATAIVVYEIPFKYNIWESSQAGMPAIPRAAAGLLGGSGFPVRRDPDALFFLLLL